MGHMRVGTLPDTRPWRKVIASIAEEESVAQIAAAVTQAASHALEAVARDAGIARVVFLMTRIVIAGKHSDFALALSAASIEVPPEPSLLDVTVGFQSSMQKWFLEKALRRTDFAIMGELAVVESLVDCVTPRASNLFPEPALVQQAFRQLSTPVGFSQLAHEFYSRFTERFLLYHLERELPLQTGPHQRFTTREDRKLFDQNLSIHCREIAEITRTYAKEWYSKTNFLTGITEKKVRYFCAHCFEKIQSELLIRGERSV